MEFMHAVPVWLNAELNRDKKRHRKPFSIHEWTITGILEFTEKKRKARAKAKKDPNSLWDRLSGAMQMLGGKADGDGNR